MELGIYKYIYVYITRIINFLESLVFISSSFLANNSNCILLTVDGSDERKMADPNKNKKKTLYY